MVAIDSTFFPYLFNHPTRIPKDPATNEPVESIQERIDLLISTLQEEKETIIIPTPALSEFLVLVKQDGPKYLKELTSNPLYSIKPFDVMAAIELAAIRIEIEKKLSKRELKAQTPESSYAKICFDRQIVAIAKANNAHTIFSEDGGVAIFATRLGVKVVQVWALPKPKETQRPFIFTETSNVIPLSVRNIDKDFTDDEKRNGEESIEEKFSNPKPASHGVSALPATSQTTDSSSEVGDKTTEASPPPAQA
jgi:predicted nucleic acid-binding protein